MQNLITHIIQEEKKSWDMYLFSLSQFGKDSEQYQKAGGTKKSERRRPKRKIAKVAA